MRAFHINKVTFGFLLAFQNSIADDEALSVVVPQIVAQCGPVPLQIQGGSPPYSVMIKKADGPDGPELINFQAVDKPSTLQWPSGITSGMVITFEVKDSKGLATHSDPSTVSPSGECPQSPQAFALDKPGGDGPPKNPDAVSRAPGGASNNSTDGATVPSTDQSVSGTSTAPSINPSGHNFSTPNLGTPTTGPSVANATSAVPHPGDLPASDIDNNTMAGQPDSIPSTAASNNSAPTPSTPPPSNTSQIRPTSNTENNSKKIGNNTSPVTSRPNPARSEASRRQIGPLCFSLFIASSAGLVTNLST